LETDERLRFLTRKKANYAALGDRLTLEWTRGVFKFVDGPALDVVSQIERRTRESEDDKAFLFLLNMLTKQGRPVSSSKQALNYAPKVMWNVQEHKNVAPKRFEAAMERLFRCGMIINGEVGRGTDRKARKGIQLTDAAVCGEVREGSS
jgi:RecA-family ATPase